MSAISTKNLTKYYGKHKGVSNINLDVREGEIFGFIGPNGAGKSTTIRMLMQLINPTSGEIKVLNQSLSTEQSVLRKNIGYLPSEINYYKDMTGKQVLEFAARANDIQLKETSTKEYAELLNFDMSKKVKSYSLGNRKKLGILQTLLHKPKLLILDEPTSGLDPLMQHSFFDLLKELNGTGMTIFFSTHVLSEVEKVCDRVAIIRNGEIIRTSKVSEIQESKKRTIEVQFAKSGNMIEKYDLKQIDSSVTFQNGIHHLTVQKEIHNALQHISQNAIQDISIHKPTLEELFMEYYEKEEGGK
ncbi:ABC transporter ATP-binding protein [Chengkuizengella axinellae]|uniref:ABC transporter ATP-binding protein n=1 Tax=Chengkuizengella axinellae TaxID=3064388 RepID=A0ABT9IWK3_9BACL|nr:ABC transporter ATP-binding protein [Chengkuizengella sp. 2205SS18-9]MDP5273727.1 ABC transporter ATP-binding protein [Chengkuizengella sp. 2205SS18-9]